MSYEAQTKVRRRALLKAGAAAGVAGMVMPEISWGATESPVKIGMVDPRTGPYASLGDNDIRGATLAVDQINKSGGILGRPVQLIAEDGQALPGPSVSKTRRLLNQSKVNFLMGAGSAAVAEAMSQVAHSAGVMYVDSSGHADDITGKNCHWTTFRTCASTWLLAAGDFEVLFKKFGKRWYFITPDYAYGHSLYRAYTEQLRKAGGTVAGNALAPLGTSDFSSYLIRAKSVHPDVLICLPGGDDLVNLLKQAVQFGLDKQMTIAGAQMELEALESLPQSALLGWWTMEWYWDQPQVPEAAAFVEAYKPYAGGKVPSAYSWFGYASAHAIALAANMAKSLDPLKVVRAMEGLQLPPAVACQPGNCHYRASNHQMIANMFPGYVPKDAAYPNLFKVADVVYSGKLANASTEASCKMTYPS